MKEPRYYVFLYNLKTFIRSIALLAFAVGLIILGINL